MIQEPSLRNRDLSSLKICLSSGAALSQEIAKRFRELTGVRLIVGWGLTEASPQVTMMALTEEFKPNYVGKPIPETVVVSVDDSGNVLPQGEVGELAVKGPQVMKEYWDNEEETRRIFTKEGWLRTGDMGYASPEGVYLLGRKKDVINSGGFKIWPHEVESVLHENKHIAEVAVVGVRDPYRGEVTIAFVVPKSETTEGELMEFCRARLTPYKIPRVFEFRASLPKSSVGKILYRMLREEYEKKVTQKGERDDEYIF